MIRASEMVYFIILEFVVVTAQKLNTQISVLSNIYMT